MAKPLRLIAPESYRRATPAERARYCNGCGGAVTGWFTRLLRWIIPQTIWGLCIKEACDIHDWCYGHGYPKPKSDAMFLVNLAILCLAGGLLLLPFRLIRCLTFYLFVVFLGRYFYGRKVAERELREAV